MVAGATTGDGIRGKNRQKVNQPRIMGPQGAMAGYEAMTRGGILDSGQKVGPGARVGGISQ